MFTEDRLPTLDARRVCLRWLTEGDVDALFEVFSDPEVMRYWSSTPFEDRAEAEQLLQRIHAHFDDRELFQWGVALRGDDRVIGTCTLFRIDESNGRAEIGFALGRDAWGRGYMTEALDALIGFAFGELRLRRLEADVDPQNAPSIRLLERKGFVKEGHLRERWHVGGKTQDSLIFGLLRDEFAATPRSR